MINEYLYNLIKLPEFKHRLITKMEGTTGRKRLPKSALAKLQIPVPTRSDQEQIASILSTVDSKIEAEERRRDGLNELFKSMLKSLMTGKVRVKDLVIQNE